MTGRTPEVTGRTPDMTGRTPEVTGRTRLTEVRLSDLGVIEEAVLELGDGLTVITGETGAGKTMLVAGLGLLLGARADAGAVRPGASGTRVEGRVDHPGADVLAVAEEAGGVVEDDELLLARTVSAEGRSRAHVGGRSVPVGVLSDVGARIVTVHGQADQQRLRGPAAQRAALDRYAGQAVVGPLTQYRRAYRRWQQVTAELAHAVDRAADQARELATLQAALADIERVAPRPGEDLALRDEADRLAHTEALREAAETAHATLVGDPADPAGTTDTDVVGMLAQAARSLERGGAHDATLADLGRRLDDSRYLLADVAVELASYLASLDADPDRLASVEARRAELAGLVRRYGEAAGVAATWSVTAGGDPTISGVEAVLGWTARAADRLATLDAGSQRVADLRRERDELLAQLAGSAATVRAGRRAAATGLAAAVGDELTGLAMPAARLVVTVSDHEDPTGLPVDGRRLAFGPDGVDEVSIELAAHPGAPLRPLGRAASGGELSRIMLAVEVVLGRVDPVPVFVFDEVDAGVGGRAAVEVGRRLARLAESAQVLVVTHLPQVAAFADRHLVVRKSDDGSVTRSGVVTVDGEARVLELSRMLAGLEGSDAATAHARELLAMAAAEAQQDGVPARRGDRRRADVSRR